MSNKNKRRGSGNAEQPLMQPADVRCASRLMDAMNPFPSSEVEKATPLLWAVAAAMARATSLHPSCVYVHMSDVQKVW